MSPLGRKLLIAASAAFVLTALVAVYVPRQVEMLLWQSELNADRSVLAGLVSAVDVPPEDADDLEALDAFASGALLRGDYVRVKLWATDGTVLFSDDPNLIGRQFPVAGGLSTALEGTASDEVSRLDRAENSGERELADRVLEVYVPVMRGGEVVAVWEIYRSLDRFDAAMARVQRIMWATVGGALAVLLVVLSGLVATLLRSLRRRSDDAIMLSSQLGTLLAVAGETSRSLDCDALSQVAVKVIREEADFDGVGLLRSSATPPQVLATSLAPVCPGACLADGASVASALERPCSTLTVEVPAGDEGLVLVACRQGAVQFTQTDENVMRAAAESVAIAWDNARLYEDRARSQATQRLLTRKLVAAHEDERRSIVGDVHDGLGQDLHRVLFGLRRARDHPADAVDELTKVEALVEASIAELRRLLRSLRPTTLEDLGLVPALRSLVATANDEGDLIVDLCADGVPQLDVSARLAVYRIVQEALHNAVKHGRAAHATVELRLDDHELIARIEDDGCGYRPNGSDGLGVWLMRERAEALGGRFDVRCIANGTEVEARIPVEETPWAT